MNTDPCSSVLPYFSLRLGRARLAVARSETSSVFREERVCVAIGDGVLEHGAKFAGLTRFAGDALQQAHRCAHRPRTEADPCNANLLQLKNRGTARCCQDVDRRAKRTDEPGDRR